jgi:hypothetical protein
MTRHLVLWGAGLGCLCGLLLLLIFRLRTPENQVSGVVSIDVPQAGSSAGPPPKTSPKDGNSVLPVPPPGGSYIGDEDTSMFSALIALAVFQAKSGKYKDAESTLDKVDPGDKDLAYATFVRKILWSSDTFRTPGKNPQNTTPSDQTTPDELFKHVTNIASKVSSPTIKIATILRILDSSSFMGNRNAAPFYEEITHVIQADQKAKEKDREANEKKAKDETARLTAEEKKETERRQTRISLQDTKTQADLLAETKRLKELQKEQSGWFWVLLIAICGGLGICVVVVGKAALEETGKQVVNHYLLKVDKPGG